MATAEEGLERLSAEEWSLLIADIGLPGMDGLVLVHQLPSLELVIARVRWPEVAASAHLTRPSQH